MTIIRRVLSVLTAFAILLSTATAVYGADTPAQKWYDGAYNTLVEAEVLLPQDEEFSPDKYIKYIEFLALACKAAGIRPEHAPSAWERAYADAAVQVGLLEECPVDQWGGTIIRFQAANLLTALIKGSLEAEGAAEVASKTLTDYHVIPEHYREGAELTYFSGIIGGKGNGAFDGFAMMSRAEAITVICRAFFPETRLASPTLPEPEPVPPEEQYKQVIGEYTTYATNSANRNFNIARAAESINGTVLQPGEQFSFNKVVGKASQANGYKSSIILSGGEYIPGYGGGICQDATTLFNAALLANLQIDQRRNHGLKSSYVKPGYDATIANPAIDLKFTNNHPVPIKITASFNSKNNAITFKIYAQTPVELPAIKIYTTGSGKNWTLYREADGVVNYKTSSTYKN